MQVANPIYDTVFKYLMSDSRIAKAILSSIIGEKIEELDFQPQEYTLKAGIDKTEIDRTLEQLRVCRIDFGAKIKTDNGYKTVIIELQKAKLSTDIMRFRQYLGKMYENPENSYEVKSNSDKLPNQKKARQIYCIYFLNYEVGFGDRPVIEVGYIVRDRWTKQEITEKNEFIESLTHNSWIIQVQKLKGKRRDETEKLLSIFDQDNLTNDQHILNVDDSQFPEKYRFIIKKLREAFESEQVREEMRAEDDFFNELLNLQKQLEKEIEENKKKDEELERKDEELEKEREENKKKDEENAKLKEELEKYKKLYEGQNK